MAEETKKSGKKTGGGKQSAEDVAKQGGIARAAKLTPQERKSIAAKAAKARWAEGGPKVPKATHAGPLRIGDIEIPSAVLDDGRRVLSQQGFLEAIGRARSAKGGQGASVTNVDDTPAFLAAKNLKPFISPELLASTTPVPYLTTGGAKAYGYAAEMLSDVCWVFINAKFAGALAHNQEHIAERSQQLVRAFGKVGIIALVDEATGYQADRDAEDLRRLLEEYLVEEIRPWVKTFTPEFFKQVYRLHGWKYSLGDTRTPRYVGKFINEYIYKQLPPNVFNALQERNPNVDGQRKYRHSQLLSGEVGVPHLEDQIKMTTVLMKGADDKGAFKRAFGRVFPGHGTQAELPGTDVPPGADPE